MNFFEQLVGIVKKNKQLQQVIENHPALQDYQKPLPSHLYDKIIRNFVSQWLTTHSKAIPQASARQAFLIYCYIAAVYLTNHPELHRAPWNVLLHYKRNGIDKLFINFMKYLQQSKE